jgi:hypothetical protein
MMASRKKEVEKEIWGVKDIADYLGYCTKTVYTKVLKASGFPPCIMSDGTRKKRFVAENVKMYFKQNQPTGGRKC